MAACTSVPFFVVDDAFPRLWDREFNFDDVAEDVWDGVGGVVEGFRLCLYVVEGVRWGLCGMCCKHFSKNKHKNEM